MVVVNKKQIDLIEGKLVGEASTMGLAPGEWPDSISVIDDKNEGLLFFKGRSTIHNSQLIGYEYWTRSGILLEVIND